MTEFLSDKEIDFVIGLYKTGSLEHTMARDIKQLRREIAFRDEIIGELTNELDQYF